MAGTCTVERETRDGVDVVTLRSESAHAEIAPALGNNCFAFVAREPVLEPVSWEDFRAKPTSYGIPIMLPFPSRVRDGRFTFGEETFTVDPPRHGMVRDKAWTVVETGSSDGGAWVTSRVDARDHAEKILSQFPFPFVVDVTYGLRGAVLDMVTVVTNVGDRPMPFGFGIHPYFRRPERGTLSVPADARWELEKDLLPTGRIVDVEGDYDLRGGIDVNAVELDDAYTRLLPDVDGLVHCAVVDEDSRTATVVEFDANEMRTAVVFMAPAPRRAVCVEPQTCPADAFNLAARGVDANLVVLGPGETRRYTIRIRATA
jgi:aldose 1-epimerase